MAFLCTGGVKDSVKALNQIIHILFTLPVEPVEEIAVPEEGVLRLEYPYVTRN